MFAFLFWITKVLKESIAFISTSFTTVLLVYSRTMQSREAIREELLFMAPTLQLSKTMCSTMSEVLEFTSRMATRCITRRITML